MSFRELTLQPSYYTTTSDIAKEFYNPVLSESVSYDRVSGYFSSQALAFYAKGLEGLIINKGRMRLIISIDISEDDFNLIKQGYTLRKELKDSLVNNIDLPSSLLEQAAFYNLAHLIANGFVDFKIGFTKTGIFHSKFGLCQDFDGDIIYFTGSNNETEAAINHNFESFDITTTWLASSFDQQKIYKAKREFEKLWNAQNSDSIIYVKEIDELLKWKIIQFDRGRVILDTEMLTENALVLTIQDDKLLLIDNLESYTIKSTDYIISNRLAPYFNPVFPDFSDDLSYNDMKKIINIFKKYSHRKNFNFIVSKKLENYLEEKTYFIEERSKYGILLKNQDEKIMGRFESFKEVVTKELSRTLRDKQMWSAFYMQQMKYAANFSVPGAGKTSMIYGVFAFLNSSEINNVDKIVMIGPKNSFSSWKLEFVENFGEKKSLRVLDIHETEMNEFQIRMDSGEKNLILINYESLPKYESVLMDIIDQRTMLVFDEGHKIKGITSKRAQAAKRVSVNAGYKYVLTGTPIPNTYQDIYNLLNILYSVDYSMFFNFKPNDLLKPTPSLIEDINEKMYPFFWRTTKQELDVPPANEDEIIQVRATSDEQAIIDMLYRKYGETPFSLYIRLMQAASNPELLLKSIDAFEIYGEEEKQKWLPYMDESIIGYTEQEVNIIHQVSVTSKYKAAMQLARELYEEKKQCIIWCMFVNTIDKVYTDLKLKGMNPAVIYGSTPQVQRDAIIESFKKGKIDVLITNPHTLAESVSLHKTCHDAIYLEYSFNLTHMLQSRDRIHRLGLLENQYTQYYYFMLTGQEDRWNTIDEKIYIRLKEKEDRMMKAVESGTLQPDPTEDYQDILDLFKM